VKRHLIVYAKRPLPGYTKARLGAEIGAEQAAGVYARLLYTYLVDLLNAGLADVHIELSVTSPADAPFFEAAFPELAVRPQIEGDLGQRIAASFTQAFAAGAGVVVLTGSDIPGLNDQIVQAAFRALESEPAVIGPTSDGGYYLIGMRAPGAPLFDDIDWGTDRVLEQTEALARARGVRLAYIVEQLDVDTIEDYERWRRWTLRAPQRGEIW
jgi:rSAM/selenodomain-associated transferase 1